MNTWKGCDSARPEGGHYSIMSLIDPSAGMRALCEMFSEGKADELNFVLFSTSGVHGTYDLIESAEARLNGEDPDGADDVTFVVVHPRMVAMRYGVCTPESQDDIDFLKALRASSFEAIASIGMPAAQLAQAAQEGK